MDPDSSPDTQDNTGPAADVRSGPPLSATQAAKVAGFNERTIRRAIAAGQLPASKHRGAYRISPAALAAWQADEAGAPPDSAADTGPAPATTGQAAVSGLSGEGATVAELWRALEEEGKATVAARGRGGPPPRSREHGDHLPP